MYKKLIDKINEYQTIIIHRHFRPDGDALGSQIGLKEIIKANFENKKVLITGDTNDRFSFVGGMDEVLDSDYKDCLAIIVDSGSESLISDERYKLASFTIKIDHHLSGNDYADLNIVDVNEISCASLIAKIAITNNLKFTSIGARALFIGLVTDSSRFRYKGVTSQTFNIASILTQYDFSIDEIYQKLYVEEYESIKLRAYFTLNISTTKMNVAYIKTPYEDILKYKTDVFTVSRGMVNVMSGIKGIDIWVNFTEDENKKVIAELRSSKYNINQVAVKYGGGGHKLASGATLNNFDEANNLLKDLEKLMEVESD